MSWPTTISKTPRYRSLLGQPVEVLAQHIMVQRDLLRELLVYKRASLRELAVLQDQISLRDAKINELEEMLEESYDVRRRLIEGNPVEWGDP